MRTKAKVNRRTLKKRIRRMIYLSSFVIILLFVLVLFGLTNLFLKPTTQGMSAMIAQTIARDMNDQVFLEQFGIEQLDQFDPNSPEAKDWIQTHIADTARLDNYLDKEELEQAETGISTHDGDLQITLEPAMEDIVYIDVRIGVTEIYSNMERDGVMNMDAWPLRTIADFYDTQVERPLMNPNGDQVGTVRVGIVPDIAAAVFIALTIVIVLIALAALLISAIVSRIFTIPIIKPMRELEATFRAVADADYDASQNNQIALKKPLREVESLLDSTNRIMKKMQGYADLLRDQNDELEAQNEELATSKARIQEAQALVVERERKLNSLLDNAGQGFLTFSEDLKIDPEYSLECKLLFGRDIAYVDFDELLAEGDDEHRTFLRNILSRLFAERDLAKRALYMPLLTGELRIEGRYIQIEYKMIPDDSEALREKCMAILTDITEKRELQLQMEEERNILKMVVKIVGNYVEFSEYLREYRAFYEIEIHEKLAKGGSLKDRLLELYRDVHTFKGNFAQLGMVHIVRELHHLETELSHRIKNADAFGFPDTIMWFDSLQMDRWIDEDVEVLRENLGDEFFNQDQILTVDKDRVLEIERKMLATLSPVECKLLLPEIRKLRFKPFKDLLKSYPDYVYGLAERLEKPVEPFAIEGGHFLANHERYGDFCRSLVHVFRNMVDHGIETPDERIAAGKPEFGRLRCSVGLLHDELVVCLEDDGRGVDLERVKQKAVELGLVPLEQLPSLGQSDLLMLLFEDEFSTRDHVSDLSGRGIGLSSVRAEVERLGGTIEAETSSGRGSSFTFRFTLEEITELPLLQEPSSLEPVIGVAEQYFREQVKLDFREHEPFSEAAGDKLSLRQVTTFINLKGAFEGMFVTSVDEPLARAILKRMVLDELSPEEENSYLEEGLAEAANIVLGNSMKMFQNFEEYMIMEPPITIYTQGASIKYADSTIWTCTMQSDYGDMTLGLVLIRKQA